MPTFLFSYRAPDKPLNEALEELSEEAQSDRLGAWMGWFDGMGESLLEQGRPVYDARPVGNCAGGTRVAGYSLIEAEDLDAAAELARSCPGIDWGGGVEVGVIGDVGAGRPIETQTASTTE